jgi:hypothetical protein
MIRFPPTGNVRAFLDLLEFVAAARPPVYPLLAPYLSVELASMPVADTDARECVERIRRLVQLDAAPPAPSEWLELFEPIDDLY